MRPEGIESLWAYGRRRERIIADAGQGHLFALDEPDADSAPPDEDAPADDERLPRRRRRSRKLDLDRLPQRRIEHDVPEEEKTCEACGRAKACIGCDESRVLNYQPAVLEVEVQ